MTSIQIFKRLYRDYTKKYVPKIFLSVFFSLLLAASTSAIAYLLDPAINELFIKQSSTLIFTIPFLIVVSFAIKGISLYLAKVIMIGVAEEVKKEVDSSTEESSGISSPNKSSFFFLLESIKRFFNIVITQGSIFSPENWFCFSNAFK